MQHGAVLFQSNNAANYYNEHDKILSATAPMLPFIYRDGKTASGKN